MKRLLQVLSVNLEIEIMYKKCETGIEQKGEEKKARGFNPAI